MDYGKATMIFVGVCCIVAGIRAVLTKEARVTRYRREDSRYELNSDQTIDKSGGAAVKQGVTWFVLGGGMLYAAFNYW